MCTTRCSPAARVFEFKSVPAEEIRPAVLRALEIMKTRTPLPLTWEPEVPALVAQGCGGDVRKSINAVELLCEAAIPEGRDAAADGGGCQGSCPSAAPCAMTGAATPCMTPPPLSTKSIRGSDPDAALHYLARFLEAGDLITPCRRLLCAASEDVGLAYPQAITIVKACVDTAMQLGLPEAQLPLGAGRHPACHGPQVQQRLHRYHVRVGGCEGGPRRATCPGSCRMSTLIPPDWSGNRATSTPTTIGHHWVRQQYLPDAIKNAHYYHYGDNKTEQAAKSYWEKIKGSSVNSVITGGRSQLAGE